MDLARIKELLKIVAESDVAEVEIEEGGLKLTVRKNLPVVTLQQTNPFAALSGAYLPGYPAMAPPMQPSPGTAPAAGPQTVAPAAPAPEEVATNGSRESQAGIVTELIVRAPIVGTFYRASHPDSAPFVQVGDVVQKGDIVCIIEAMKLMNEIECEYSGTVRQILVENSEPVEYDQPLFVIDPS